MKKLYSITTEFLLFTLFISGITAVRSEEQNLLLEPDVHSLGEKYIVKNKNSSLWEYYDRKRKESIGISYGVFYRGYYDFWNSGNEGLNLCNVHTFCLDGDKDEELFGSIASVDYNLKLLNKRLYVIDLDTSFSIGHQDLNNSWYQDIPSEKQSNEFIIISAVPTIRTRLPKPLKNISLGFGAGLSYAIGNLSYEYPYDVPLMAAINSEIAWKPKYDSRNEIYFGVNHRCAVFGLLNTKDDSQVGSQWYKLGVRTLF